MDKWICKKNHGKHRLFSAYPDYATFALLTRCTDGNKVIEWEQRQYQKTSKKKYVYFSWVAAHSSGTSRVPEF